MPTVTAASSVQSPPVKTSWSIPMLGAQDTFVNSRLGTGGRNHP